MKRAIVTGFEPFGSYKFNPTQDLAREYDKRILNDIEITGLVLPCKYYGAFEVLSEKINKLSPDIIISTGLSSRIQKIRLEAIGKNIMNGKYADADGKKPDNEPIIKDGRSWYSTTPGNLELATCLNKAAIPAEVSFDAEGFICNSLLYLTARRIYEEHLPVKFVFVHTPWTDDYQGRVELEQGKIMIKKQDLGRALEILLANVKI